MNSCSLYYSTLALNSTRRISDILSSFESYIADSQNIPSGVIYYSSLADNSSIVNIYNAMQSYFSSSYINSGTFDLLLDCIYAIYSTDAVLSIDLINESITFLSQIIQQNQNILTDSQFEKILKNLDLVSTSADSNTLNNLLTLISKLWVTHQIPGKEFYFINRIYCWIGRFHGNILRDYDLQRLWGEIFFPIDININETDIYDVVFTRILNNEEYIYKINIYNSGKYSNFTLILTSPQEIQIIGNSPIEVTIPISIDVTNELACVGIESLNWTAPICAISSFTSSAITADIYCPSSFKIIETVNDYRLEKLCIYIIYSIAASGLIIIGIYYYIDRKNEESYEKKLFIHLYPISSLMISQNKPWRTLMALQIITSEVLLLALIGGFYQYFYSNATVEVVYVMKGAFPLCLSQSFTISSTILNFSVLKHINIRKIPIFLCLIVLGLSIGAILMISLQNNYQIFAVWLTSFALWSVVDLFILQLLYSLFMKSRNQTLISRVTNMSFSGIFDNTNLFENSSKKLQQVDSEEEFSELKGKKTEKIEKDRASPMSVRVLSAEDIPQESANLKHYNTQFS